MSVPENKIFHAYKGDVYQGTVMATIEGWEGYAVAHGLKAGEAPNNADQSADELRTLNRKQFTFLLKLTGFGTVWDALAEAAEAAGDMATAAALEGERASEVFRLDRTLQLVALMGPKVAKIAPDVKLNETAIREAWAAAETWKGLGNG